MQVILVSGHLDNFGNNSLLCPIRAKLFHELLQVHGSSFTDSIYCKSRQHTSVRISSNSWCGSLYLIPIPPFNTQKQKQQNRLPKVIKSSLWKAQSRFYFSLNEHSLHILLYLVYFNCSTSKVKDVT